MKVVFVGPTVPDADGLVGGGIVVRPPACQGDIVDALGEGANVIGLVDGNFEYVAPVWHKEILYALSQGVHVFGAASMGALRAAECSAYGMRGVGDIFRQFESGARVDDADVAQIHAPPELGYLSLSLPMVNLEATVQALVSRRFLTPRTAATVVSAARSIFFKQRTFEAIAERITGFPELADVKVPDLLRTHWVDQKRKDALDLIAIVALTDDLRGARPGSWSFNSTTTWEKAFQNRWL